MSDYSLVNDILCEKADVKKEEIINHIIKINDLSFMKLRDSLYQVGAIIYEDLERCIYIATVNSGFANKNYAQIAFQWTEQELILAAYAEEGIVKQHTSELAIKKILQSIDKYIDQDVAGNGDTIVGKKSGNKSKWILGVVILAFVFATILSNRHQKEVNDQKEKALKLHQQEVEAYLNACIEYNDAVKSYNSKVEKYNAFLGKVAAYNKELPEPLSSREELPTDNLEERNGYDIKSIYEDIETLKKGSDEITDKYIEIYKLTYNALVDDYNILTTEYNSAVQVTSIDFLTDISLSATEMRYEEDVTDLTEEKIYELLDGVVKEIEKLGAEYLVVTQITNPEESWVMERLKNLDDITSIQAVTSDKDPNHLLGKDGGYTSCIYFGIKGLNTTLTKGNDIVEKGTDAGGSIEVYDTLEHALNRCDYLSQFDGTLLYSGSYTIVGTMVIRTSYRLESQQQVEWTKLIVKEFTKVY